MVGPDRVFYTHRQYREYLGAYAERFGLRQHITFGAVVEEVRKGEDGRWSVTVATNGARQTSVFDAVAVCSGPFQAPDTTSVPDIDKFAGEVVHSSTYRNNARFAGKRVLIVGLAESGADIAREVSDVASASTLSIRSYSFLIPRMHNAEYATDATDTRVADLRPLRALGAAALPRSWPCTATARSSGRSFHDRWPGPTG